MSFLNGATEWLGNSISAVASKMVFWSEWDVTSQLFLYGIVGFIAFTYINIKRVANQSASPTKRNKFKRAKRFG